MGGKSKPSMGRHNCHNVNYFNSFFFSKQWQVKRETISAWLPVTDLILRPHVRRNYNNGVNAVYIETNDFLREQLFVKIKSIYYLQLTIDICCKFTNVCDSCF